MGHRPRLATVPSLVRVSRLEASPDLLDRRMLSREVLARQVHVGRRLATAKHAVLFHVSLAAVLYLDTALRGMMLVDILGRLFSSLLDLLICSPGLVKVLGEAAVLNHLVLALLLEERPHAHGFCVVAHRVVLGYGHDKWLNFLSFLR